MDAFDEIQELQRLLDSALTSARINLNHSTEMTQLHPGHGNEKFIELDKHNIQVIENMIDEFKAIKSYPD